jgi:hypothetical protein
VANADLGEPHQRRERASVHGHYVLIYECSVCLPDQLIHLSGDVLADRIRDVLVPGGHLRARPAHERHNGSHRDADDQEHGRGRVPGVVEPRLAQASALEQVLPLALVSVRAERPASRRSKHPIFVVPKLTRSRPLDVLLGSMPSHKFGQLTREADYPPSRP